MAREESLKMEKLVFVPRELLAMTEVIARFHSRMFPRGLMRMLEGMARFHYWATMQGIIKHFEDVESLSRRLEEILRKPRNSRDLLFI